MAESPDKAVQGAEKTHAAAAEAKPNPPEPAKPEAPVASEPTPVAKPVAAKNETKSAAPKRKLAKRKVVTKPAAKAKPAKTPKPGREADKPASTALGRTKPSITELKEKIMANAKNTDFTKPFADAMGEMQAKAKGAYDKGTAYAGEIAEFAKGNVEALVESGKVLSAGAQDMGKTYADDAKTVYETLTADVKEMAAVKSPTELFQLQSKIARRNFDTMVAFSSKTGDAMLKLYADAFAPISGRVSLAAEKISKAA